MQDLQSPRSKGSCRGARGASQGKVFAMGKVFTIFGLPSRVRYDRSPHFCRAFEDLLRECSIPTNPSSLYNPESNGLAEQHVGLAKNLLKKCLESKEDYQTAISVMNATTRPCGYSPSEMFLKRRIRTKLPDIRGQPSFELAAQARDEEHTKMREALRKNKARPALEVGEIVLLYEETGSKKGMFHRECEVLSIRENGILYFVQEIDTDNRFLRARNKLRPLKELEPNSIAV